MRYQYVSLRDYVVETFYPRASFYFFGPARHAGKTRFEPVEHPGLPCGGHVVVSYTQFVGVVACGNLYEIEHAG